jgi:excisionase family DNA binding protein
LASCTAIVVFVNCGTEFIKFVGRRIALENLFSVEEAARRLGGISKWTIHAWLSQGRLRRTKVGGRTMIRESELAKVIEDGGKSPSRRREKE